MFEFVALVVAGLGAGVGVWAAWQSRKANAIAQEALKESKAANKFAADANLIAGEANRIAVEANELSQEANSISERTHALQTERNDVGWDYEWVGAGLVRLTNTGQDEAHIVRARLTCGDEVQTAERDTVDSGGFIDFEFPGARDEELAYEARVAENKRRAGSRLTLNPMPPLVGPVHGRITWLTPLDRHAVHEF